VIAQAQIDPVGVELTDPGREDAGENEDREDEEARDGQPVTEEPARGISPQCPLPFLVDDEGRACISHS